MSHHLHTHSLAVFSFGFESVHAHTPQGTVTTCARLLVVDWPCADNKGVFCRRRRLCLQADASACRQRHASLEELFDEVLPVLSKALSAAGSGDELDSGSFRVLTSRAHSCGYGFTVSRL
jgi:hypothetical protein